MFVLAFVIVFFLLSKNLDFSNTSLEEWIGIEEESLMIFATLPFGTPKVRPELIFGDFRVNLFETFVLNKLLYLSEGSESHLELYMKNMKFQTTLSKFFSSGILFVLLFTTFLILMKLAMYSKEVYIFLESISKNFIVPKIEIG